MGNIKTRSDCQEFTLLQKKKKKKKKGREGGAFSFYNVTGSRNQVGMKKVYTFPRLPIWGANKIRCLHCFLEIKGFPGMNYKKKPQTSVSQIDGPMNSYVYTLLL